MVVHHGVIKSLIVIFSLLVPAAELLYVCDGWWVGMVGADYAAGGLAVLRVMGLPEGARFVVAGVAASLLREINCVYFAIKEDLRRICGG